MIHPHTELRFISPEIGYGVVATQFIPKGTITWAMDKFDRFFMPAEVEKMEKVYQDIVDKYCYRDSKGRFILCWDISRYVNHSFNSNCITTPYEFEIAIRDIHPGEELTDDYGYLNVSEPFECLPEPGSTRTKVMPDDLLNFYKEWDDKLREGIRNFNNVSQPLLHILPPDTQKKAISVALGQEMMDSIKTCYYDPNKKV